MVLDIVHSEIVQRTEKEHGEVALSTKMETHKTAR